MFGPGKTTWLDECIVLLDVTNITVLMTHFVQASPSLKESTSTNFDLNLCPSKSERESGTSLTQTSDPRLKDSGNPLLQEKLPEPLKTETTTRFPFMYQINLGPRLLQSKQRTTTRT